MSKWDGMSMIELPYIGVPPIMPRFACLGPCPRNVGAVATPRRRVTPLTDLRLAYVHRISLPSASLLRSICQMPMRGVGATLSAHTLGTQAGGHDLPGAVSARGRLTRVRRIRACVRPVVPSYPLG